MKENVSFVIVVVQPVKDLILLIALHAHLQHIFIMDIVYTHVQMDFMLIKQPNNVSTVILPVQPVIKQGNVNLAQQDFI